MKTGWLGAHVIAAFVCALALLPHISDAATFTSYQGPLGRFVVDVATGRPASHEPPVLPTEFYATNGGITVTGPIEPGDDVRFRDLIDALIQGRVYRTHVYPGAIYLNSPGGNVAAAVAMADIVLRDLLITTVENGMTCASACALIYFAGDLRFIEGSGRVGVHRASTPDGDEAPDASLFTAAKLRQFCAPRSAVAKLLATPPGGIAWLDSRDSSGASSFRCDGDVSSVERAQRQMQR